MKELERGIRLVALVMLTSAFALAGCADSGVPAVGGVQPHPNEPEPELPDDGLAEEAEAYCPTGTLGCPCDPEARCRGELACIVGHCREASDPAETEHVIYLEDGWSLERRDADLDEFYLRAPTAEDLQRVGPDSVVMARDWTLARQVLWFEPVDERTLLVGSRSATLPDVMPNGHIRGALRFPSAGAEEKALGDITIEETSHYFSEVLSLGSVVLLSGSLASGRYYVAIENLTIRVAGSVRYEFRTERRRIHDATLVLTGASRVSGTLLVRADGEVTRSQPVDLGVSIPIPVASAVGATVELGITATGSVSLSAAAEAKATLEVVGKFEAGFEYDRGTESFIPVREGELRFEGGTPAMEVAATADVRVELRPYVGMSIFLKSTGGTVGVAGYTGARFTSDRAAWEIYGGLDADIFAWVLGSERTWSRTIVGETVLRSGTLPGCIDFDGDGFGLGSSCRDEDCNDRDSDVGGGPLCAPTCNSPCEVGESRCQAGTATSYHFDHCVPSGADSTCGTWRRTACDHGGGFCEDERCAFALPEPSLRLNTTSASIDERVTLSLSAAHIADREISVQCEVNGGRFESGPSTYVSEWTRSIDRDLGVRFTSEGYKSVQCYSSDRLGTRSGSVHVGLAVGDTSNASNSPPPRPVIAPVYTAHVDEPESVEVTVGPDPDGDRVKFHCVSPNSNHSDDGPFESEYFTRGGSAYPTFTWSRSGDATIYCTAFDEHGTSSVTANETLRVEGDATCTPNGSETSYCSGTEVWERDSCGATRLKHTCASGCLNGRCTSGSDDELFSLAARPSQGITTRSSACDESSGRAIYRATLESMDAATNSATIRFEKCDHTTPSTSLNYWVVVGVTSPDDDTLCTAPDCTRATGTWSSSSETLRVSNIPIWPSSASLESDGCGSSKSLYLITDGRDGEGIRRWYQFEAITFTKTCS